MSSASGETWHIAQYRGSPTPHNDQQNDRMIDRQLKLKVAVLSNHSTEMRKANNKNVWSNSLNLPVKKNQQPRFLNLDLWTEKQEINKNKAAQFQRK